MNTTTTKGCKGVVTFKSETLNANTDADMKKIYFEYRSNIDSYTSRTILVATAILYYFVGCACCFHLQVF